MTRRTSGCWAAAGITTINRANRIRIVAPGSIYQAADLDLVMTAAAPSEAPRIEEVSKFAIMERPSLTMPFNVTGSPAMSVCCGYTEAGLPLSFQIVGKRFEDATVLRAAHAYEQATPWRGRRPEL